MSESSVVRGVMHESLFVGVVSKSTMNYDDAVP